MNGVLVMAYGGPDKLDDVGPYILDVRNHRPTRPELIEEMRNRYERIGGRSPILERTRAQAAVLSDSLRGLGVDARVYTGMRHWHPYIGDVIREMEADGVTRAVGIVMAPHYSRMSIGAYARKVREADSAVTFRVIESWHLLPGFLDAVTNRVEAALSRFGDDAHAVRLIFTAHSLPERILADGDPYADQLAETFERLSRRFARHECRFAYQSAAMTPDPWLGPDAGEVVSAMAAEGDRNFLIVPIGFTSDHVEILYDIDIEYRDLADRLGVRLERIEMVNDDALMMGGLAELVSETMRAAGWR